MASPFERKKEKKNNERVKNSPFVSFPQYKPIYSCGWTCAMVAEQSNDYNNYSHHLSQWALVLFLLVKRKKNGSMSPNFSFCIYLTSAYWKFYCVVIPDVFGGLNPGSIPSRKPLFESCPLASLNPSRDGNRSGLLLSNLCVPRSAPLTGTGRGHQGPACENTDPLDDPTACPAPPWLHQPSENLCVSPEDFPRARKDAEWLARELGLLRIPSYK